MSQQLGSLLCNCIPCVPGDGYVYFQDNAGALQRASLVDPTSCTPLFPKMYFSPAVSLDGHVYFIGPPFGGGTGSALMQLKISYPKNPINLGNYQISGESSGDMTPVVTNDGYLYFVTDDVYQVAIADPAEPTGYNIGNLCQPCVPGDGFVYFMGSDRKLYQLDVSGDPSSLNWLGNQYTVAAPCVPGDGNIYFSNERSELCMMPLQYPPDPVPTPTPLKQSSTSTPAVPGDGYLYYLGTDGVLNMMNLQTLDARPMGTCPGGGGPNKSWYPACIPPGQGVAYFCNKSSALASNDPDHGLMVESLEQDYWATQTGYVQGARSARAGLADLPLWEPSSWMQTLFDNSDFGTKTLADIALPGTHDSGMYKVDALKKR